MNLTRRLTDGVGAWLHFEYMCNRSGLFSERYLSTAVGQILGATFGDRVLAEFEHPVLGPEMEGSGGRPALDFVYCNPYPEIKVAVETKWAGSSHTTPATIIWDLIRLEMVANLYSATAIFLLAGQRADLTKLFRSPAFAGPGKVPGVTPILSTTHNSIAKLSLLPDKHYRIPLLRAVYEKRQTTRIPHAVLTRRSRPFPENCRANEFQVFAWEVLPTHNRADFLPGESKHFKAFPKITPASDSRAST